MKYIKKLVNLTGLKVNRWSILFYEGRSKGGQLKCRCRCECGTERLVLVTKIRNGNSKSCGCLSREINRARTIIDLSGKKIGWIQVVSIATEKPKVKYRTTWWNCFCELCKKQCIMSTSSLRTESTKSCGCHRLSKRWKESVGEFPKYHWKSIKKGAIDRNYEITIDMKYCWELFLKQNKRCSLSGLDLTFKGPNSKVVTASLDRINSSEGYIRGNVQWVHKDINFMKQQFSQEYFIDICKKITDTQTLKTWCVIKRNGN